MRKLSSLYAAFAVLALAVPAAGARAADDPGYFPGPWHFRSVSCVDTNVTLVGPRLADEGQHAPFPPSQYASSGVVVTYASGLGMRPVFPKAFAAVVHYQDDASNPIMEAEKPGDRVQLCFLGGPYPQVGANAALGCNPDTDSRGRQYRVWDYKQNKQYAGYNAEHLCGGA